jgi:hypothetical protein
MPDLISLIRRVTTDVYWLFHIQPPWLPFAFQNAAELPTSEARRIRYASDSGKDIPFMTPDILESLLSNFLCLRSLLHGGNFSVQRNGHVHEFSRWFPLHSAISCRCHCLQTDRGYWPLIHTSALSFSLWYADWYLGLRWSGFEPQLLTRGLCQLGCCWGPSPSTLPSSPIFIWLSIISGQPDGALNLYIPLHCRNQVTACLFSYGCH